ncbi:MAG: 50S ribosomal protein L25/general stress protein Ctc [Alphaproteobacteria bacterium]|nr:50S ribosomal protein L25/general stress protein Ctc [Alphaproteobacteria bacterium]
MVEIVKIDAAARERAGKGAARATRRAGMVPAVIYGGKQAASLIALDPRILLRELHKPGWRSHLYDVTANGRTERCLLRDVQLHVVTDRPQHADFQRLAAGEPIHVAIAVRFLNAERSPGIKRGGVLNVVRHEVDVICTPENIPDVIEVDLAELDIGASVHISAIKLPESVRPTITDRDFTICSVAAPTKLEVEAKPAEGEAAAAAAAPAAGAAAGAAKPAEKGKG